MGNIVTVTGMIVMASPLKEYDRRVELLTREKGRIAAFAKGARRANSALSACTLPFVFGEFSLYEGRDAYQLQSGVIQKFFGSLAQDYDRSCYASYFAELARYFTRENLEASDELLLLYVTLAAMQTEKIPLPLIRIVYEMRTMLIAGQGLELFECLHCKRTGADSVYFGAGGLVCRECAEKDSTLQKAYPFVLTSDALYTLQYIMTAPLEKLYSFLVSEAVQQELVYFMRAYRASCLPHHFKSEDFLE